MQIEKRNSAKMQPYKISLSSNDERTIQKALTEIIDSLNLTHNAESYAITVIPYGQAYNVGLHIPSISSTPITEITLHFSTYAGKWGADMVNSDIVNWAKPKLKEYGLDASDADILALVSSAVWGLAKDAN